MLCKIVLPSNEIFKLPSLPGTYEELFSAVRTRLQEDSMKIFILKYLDSDKELVSLTNQEDLQTAILTSQIDRMTTLRIFVSFRENSESIPMTVGPQTEQSSVSSKLIKVLEKVGSHDQVRSGQSQAFEKLKNHPASTLKTITENQVEAISSLIGARVEQAMEKNIKGLIPGLIAQFHEQRKTLINSHVSENQPESSLGSPELAYFTPTTRKADWFGSSCTECMCSECKNQIKGVKYVCLECSNYKCCEECENRESHNHPLLKLRVSQVVQTRRSLKINTNPRSNLLISPEAAKTCGKIPMSRQLLLKSVGEKKVPYSGKIFFENEEDCLIKIQPSQEYQVAVIVENIGKESWPVNARLRCVNGNFRNRQEELVPLDAGTRQVLHLDVQAPAQSGRYLSQWKLYYNDEEKVRPFGESLFIEMHVEDKSLRYSKSNKEEAFEKQSSSKRSTLTIRRGNTFSDTYSNIKEERRKLEQTESLNRKEVMAAYLNELFPGSIEEKLEFLNKEVCNIENEDMSKIIEFYLQSLGKRRNGRSSQGNQRQDNQELMYTIS